MSDIQEIFGENGVISKHHKGYEYRAGQIQMAEAVLRAFEEKNHLIVEAGTGTGKTLAYLVPAIASAVANGERIVISTGTKNLQEQLMEKDIPFLQKILPKKFKAVCMKGRANYACLYKIKKAENMPILEGLEDLDNFDQIRHWSRETENGDRAELVDLPENLSFWKQIDARSESCLGQKCPDFDPCFITKMRQKANEAQVIIVNHHLFFADLNIRGGEYGKVLPDYSAVIFDEAHLIEDIAADYFGFQVSSYQVEEIVRDANTLPITDVAINRDVMKQSNRILGFADRLWSGFQQGRGQDGRFPILPGTFARAGKNGEVDATPAGEAYMMLDGALQRMETTLDGLKDQPTEIESLVRRIRQMRFDLDFIVSGDDKLFVYWLERRGRGIFLRASPIDVSALLQDKLFEKIDTCVLTSATLSSAGKFEFIKNRLGLNDGKTETLLAPSSFDFQKQAVVYLPKTMPDPRSPDFSKAAAEEIMQLLQITQGRAFVLSTSNASMNALYEIVSSRVNFPCFVQGSISKNALLEKFKSTPNAVLFATSSFWQGVDVRGEQLSCVIIDKLPFSVPSDPIVAARSRFIDENGGSSFFEYSVPNAIISLKQGIGRLIRSTTDKGVIALLDPRLSTKAYGKTFIQSLPRCRIIREINDVAQILE